MTNEIVRGRYNDGALFNALNHIKHINQRDNSALVIAPLYGTIIHENDPHQIMPPRERASNIIKLAMDKEIPIFYSSPKNYSSTIYDLRRAFPANEEFVLDFYERRMLPHKGNDLFTTLYSKLNEEHINPENVFLITTKDDFCNYPRNRLDLTFLIPPYNEIVPPRPELDSSRSVFY